MSKMTYKEIENYILEDTGLPYPVTLKNGVSRVYRNGKERGIAIPNMDGLLRQIAITRLDLPNMFRGEEIRFIRTVMDARAKDLAGQLAVAPETFSRWENNKQNMDETAERLFRVIALTELCGRDFDISVVLTRARRAQFNDGLYPKLNFYMPNEASEEENWIGNLAA